jgi:L-Ala-D/L-Glu epimerase
MYISMQVKITQIDVLPLEIALSEPFVISKGALTHAKLTAIRIHTDQGVTGLGESCPYRSIHGETQEGSVAFAKVLARELIGRNPLHIREHVATMDRMIVGNASIKCAFDMALYDLAAKLSDMPLYLYLQGKRGKKIHTDNTVSLLPKEKMAEKALKFKEMGFPVLKIKLGDRPSSNDVDRVRAIRQAVGNELPLRLDANQGWNYLEARRALEALTELNIEHCEEPVFAGSIDDQARITAESAIPIMADEAVFSPQDALRVIRQQAADLLNIKLGKSGGICHAMKIASIAEAADMYCQVGSFSESRVGISALVHFDMAWDHIIYHDLDSPLMHAEDPVVGGMTYSKEWEVTVDDSPGHGADYDSDFLKRFECISVK